MEEERMASRLELRSERLARLEGQIEAIHERMAAEGRKTPTAEEWARITSLVERSSTAGNEEPA
jgi:hypothetical protein